jgi:anaerobic glycerol-3-phosphate dehydrogenase
MYSSSICGGGLAGLICGISEGNPTPSRYALIDAGSVSAAQENRATAGIIQG